MTNQSKALIIDLALKRISIDEFLKRYPVDPRVDAGHIDNLLRQASTQRDGKAVEAALILSSVFDIPVRAALLGDLIAADWHEQHENLARLLQQAGDPSTVANLVVAAVARHPYLEFDDAFALARKCTWALADIGTVEARHALMRLTSNDNPTIAGYAQERLDRWAEELPRKATTSQGPPKSGQV